MPIENISSNIADTAQIRDLSMLQLTPCNVQMLARAATMLQTRDSRSKLQQIACNWQISTSKCFKYYANKRFQLKHAAYTTARGKHRV